MSLVAPTLYETPVNVACVITDYHQYQSGRYQRFKTLLEFQSSAMVPVVDLVGMPPRLVVQALGFAAGGTVLPLNTLGHVRIDMGVQAVDQNGNLGPMNVRASYKITGTEHGGTLTGAFVDEADGPILLTYFGVDAAGVSTKQMTHGAYLNRTGAGKNHPYAWIQNNTRNWETIYGWGINPSHQYALVKVADLSTTRVRALTRLVGPTFNATKGAGQITRVELVPGNSSQNTDNAVQIAQDGIVNTEARQNYTYADLVLARPLLPILDGPRGVGTVPYPTSLTPGRNGKTYGTDPWHAFVVDQQANKRTLFGIRHKYPLNWDYTKLGGVESEVVGQFFDLDGVTPLAPSASYAWECWSGPVWDGRSLFPINMAASIPPGEIEHPHATGPRAFYTDRHGCILEAVFGATSHGTPAVITRWCPVNDPFTVVWIGSYLYVWERGGNKISIWSADKRNTYIGDLISDPTAAALGKIDPQGRQWVGANVATCRQHVMVAPEGGAIMDGYVYWGSSACAEYRRAPITIDANGLASVTGAWGVACRPTYNEKSMYLTMAMSPGTFGPRGMIASTTWSIATFGRPEFFLPIPGVAPDGTPLSHSKSWQWQAYAAGLIQGRGLVMGSQNAWESDSYAATVAFGYEGNPAFPNDPSYGVMVCASANGNISAYYASDDFYDGPLLTGTAQANYQAALKRGTVKYQQHYETLHGSFCKGPNWALPWGADPDVDVFMQACGMSPAATGV